MPHKEILGLDVGMVRIGVARASDVARLAEPLSSIGTDGAIFELQEIVTTRDTKAIVIGLPRNLEGNDTAQTEWVRQWVKTVKNQIKLPFYWQDEALTSQIVGNKKQGTGNRQDEHSLAAAIILQDFLDTPEADRVVC